MISDQFMNGVYPVSAHRQGIDVPVTVIADAAIQAQTITSVAGCERFPRNGLRALCLPSTNRSAAEKEVVEEVLTFNSTGA
jgi:hypothetical protein